MPMKSGFITRNLPQVALRREASYIRSMGGGHTVFYDGVCGLCDRFTQFVLRSDTGDRFRFAPLQGGYAVRVLGKHGIALAPGGAQGRALDTVYVLTADGRLLKRTDAVLFVLSQLERAHSWARLLAIFPRPLRELGYWMVARGRYRLFGKADACIVPRGDVANKFIPDSRSP
jgi:predicted DCC family thiol-disulfide oxidoreductase YuxK